MSRADQEPRRVGTAKGPGEKPHEFLFITPDREGVAKSGEFVFYAIPGDDRRVIARVIGRRSVRGYPDDFLADPDVPPSLVARVAGFDAEECELFEVSATIVGYYDQQLKTLINPRIPPRVGWPIFLAPADMLVDVLNKRQRDSQGSCYLGWLLSRAEQEVPVVLSAREFTSTHLAIIAGTGAGKSYTAGVLIEELLRPSNKACVLVLDPHGEYSTLEEIQNRRDLFTDGQYQARVKTLLPDDLKVRFSSLTLHDLRYLLVDVPERQDWLLGRAYNALLKESSERTRQSDRWTVEDLLDRIRQIAHDNSDGGLDVRSSAEGLRWRLEKLTQDSRIFRETEHLSLPELLQPGQCTIVQMHDLSQREQQVIAAVLLRRIYKARTDTLHGRIGSGDMYLPYPVFCLLEEAHTFAPGGESGRNVVSAQILKQILGEGRKFGIGIGLISQRPGKLDQDVLSQAMTQVIMRIVNPLDQQAVAAAVESASREVLDELPALSKGHAIVLGASLNAPALIQVRPRLTTHGGDDLDAPGEWNAWFSADAVRKRSQDAAGFRERGGSGVGIRGERWTEEDDYDYSQIFGPPKRSSDPGASDP